MMNKILTILKVIIGVVAAILFLRILSADGDALEVDTDLQNSILSPFMILAYVVFGLTVLITLLFSIKELFQGNVKKTLISIGAFAAVIIIAFFISTGKERQLDDGEVLTAYASKWISAGLNIFYILVVISVLAIIVSSVRKVLTNRA
ncbi:MAG: hypothetical protein RI535_08010 [Psychroflexus sp.]|nr:hypothetical protein [Psychroflexus sp.]